MNKDPQKKVTIEGLMRFKRNEQPAPEFWRSFDRELRAKQLAAIVERPSWWTSLLAPFAYVRKHPALCGAAAAVLLSFASYHYIHSLSNQGLSLNSSQSVADVAVPLADTDEQTDKDDTQAVEVSRPKVSTVAQVSYKTSHGAVEVQDKRFQSSGFRTEFSDIDSPSARLIASNLAAAQASHPEMISHLLALDSRIVSATTADYSREPLEHVVSPSEERRARLLATSLPSATRADSRMVSSGIERTISNLSTDRLYQSIHRYDVGSDKISMTVKF